MEFTEQKFRELSYIPRQIFGRPRTFEIVELKVQPGKSFRWQAKIKFKDLFDEFFPIYNLHFIVNPNGYQRNIKENIEKLMSDQLTLEHTEDEFLDKIDQAKKAYVQNAERFGIHTFNDIRLNEYKYDLGREEETDTVTFIVPDKFVNFYMENKENLYELAIVANDRAHQGYAIAKVRKEALGQDQLDQQDIAAYNIILDPPPSLPKAK